MSAKIVDAYCLGGACLCGTMAGVVWRQAGAQGNSTYKACITTEPVISRRIGGSVLIATKMEIKCQGRSNKLRKY